MADMENMAYHRSLDDDRYTFKGVGNAGLATGIIGTALGVLSGGLGLFNGNGIGGHASNYVSKETFDKQNEISALSSEIALLKADKNTEAKMIDVYERVTSRILANERSYADDKMAQAVINANVQSAIAVNSNNINQLMAMTKLVIPSGNVCPNPMPLYNSWKEPAQ